MLSIALPSVNKPNHLTGLRTMIFIKYYLKSWNLRRNTQRRSIMFRRKSGVPRTAGCILRLCFILVVGTMVLSGCGTSNHGRLQNSREASQIFENNQLLPDHTYYYSGFQRIPYCIIGIDNTYTLRSNRWRPIELNPMLLNQLKYRMAHVYSLDPRGAWILDPEGNRVGIWYSSQSNTRIRIEKNNQIVVVTPEPPDLRGIP